MSFGKMKNQIEIISTAPVRDSEGFVSTGDTVVANVRAYFEPKNSTEKWRNNAAFAQASALFRFRAIPGVVVDAKLCIIHAGERYRIISAEDVRGRGMYVEALAERLEPSVR